MFEWTLGNAYNIVITLYPNNITLNSFAGSYFNDVRYCILGLDCENYQLAIKPISKNEIETKAIKIENLHKVSIGKGYARISNKNIINDISSLLNLEIISQKFSGTYNERENMLIIDLKIKDKEI